MKHTSNHSYEWKYWVSFREMISRFVALANLESLTVQEVLNEVDAGESGTHCVSLNSSKSAPLCARKYTEIYDGIVTVLA